MHGRSSYGPDGGMNTSNTRILACSDFGSYKGFIEIFDQNKPDLLLLAGDLTSDGRAEFWGPEVVEWVDGKFVVTPELKLRKTTHVEKFYGVLKHASRNSKVFVVKGDHDDDFEGDYDVERINSIKNCHEISGKLVTFRNIRILGLGYYETHYLRTLRPLIEKMKDKIDVVLTHAEQRRLPLITQIRPELIIRGHFGLGRYKANGVSVVSPLFPDCYTTMETQNGVIRKVDSWFYCTRAKKWENCTLSCAYTARVIEKQKSLWPWLDRVLENCPLARAERISHSIGSNLRTC